MSAREVAPSLRFSSNGPPYPQKMPRGKKLIPSKNDSPIFNLEDKVDLKVARMISS
jgi:hypothetical protein